MLNYSVLNENKALKKAVIEGDVNEFLKQLDELKKKNNGKLSKEQIKSIFYNTHLIASIINQDMDIIRRKSAEYNLILFHILNNLQEADLNITDLETHWGFLGVNGNELMNSYIDHEANHNPRLLFNVAQELNLDAVRNHLLTKREAEASAIRALLLAENFEAARARLEQAKATLGLQKHDVINANFINTVLVRMEPPTPEEIAWMDRIMDHIFVHNDFVVNNTVWSCIASGSFPNSVNTLPYRLMRALNLLETIGSGAEESLVALELLDAYLETIPPGEARRDYLAGLLDTCCLVWSFADTTTDTMKRKQIQILRALLNRGAIKSDSNPDQLSNTYLHLIALDAGTGALFNHTGLTVNLRNSSDNELKDILNAAMACIPTSDPTKKNASETLVKLLCNRIRLNAGLYDINELINMLTKANDPTVADPVAKESRDHIFKSLRHLMQHGLIKNLDQIKPGSHSLPFIDPATNTAPVDLHKFIMMNPQLKAGFMAHIREEEFLSLYPFIKSLMADDPRAQEELDEVERTVTDISHGGHAHKLSAIRAFMREYPLIGVAIAKELDPSILPPEVRERTARRFTVIGEQYKKAIASESSPKDKPMPEPDKSNPKKPI